MSDDRTPEEVSKELMVQAEDVLGKARERVERHRQLLEKLGVSEEQVHGYLQRHDVPQANQELVRLQVRKLDDEVRSEMRRERQEEKGTKPRGMGRRGALRI